jgi:hypothetical protein
LYTARFIALLKNPPWDIYKTIPTVSFPEEAKAIQDHPKHGPAVVVPGLAENLKVAFDRTCLLSEV